MSDAWFSFDSYPDDDGKTTKIIVFAGPNPPEPDSVADWTPEPEPEPPKE